MHIKMSGYLIQSKPIQSNLCIYLPTYLSIYLSLSLSQSVCTHPDISDGIYCFTHIYIYTLIYIYIYIDIYIYIYVYIYIHIYNLHTHINRQAITVACQYYPHGSGGSSSSGSQDCGQGHVMNIHEYRS